MKLYSRCTNTMVEKLFNTINKLEFTIREIRYVEKYFSINRYQCNNKVILGNRCNLCKGDA